MPPSVPALLAEVSASIDPSTLAFQLLKIGNEIRFVRGVIVKNLSVVHSYCVTISCFFGLCRPMRPEKPKLL